MMVPAGQPAATNAAQVPAPHKTRCTKPVIIAAVLVLVVLIGGAVGAAVYVTQAQTNTATSNSNNEGGLSTSGTQSPTVLGPSTRTPTTPNGLPGTQTPTLATSSSGFNLQLVFTSTLSNADTQAFLSAKARWQTILTTGFASQAVIPTGLAICGQPAATSSVIVEDILIYVDVSYIDGAGGILGQAGPCGYLNGQVRLGTMTFDSADTANMANAGTLNSVILHEMAHVLGLGTQWDANSLISPPTVTSNIQYFGTQGNLGNTEIGLIGRAVIEDTGGSGTARGHWKETVYNNELMTGYISTANNPLSRLTARSLADLGYAIDVTKADSFTATSGRRLRQSHAGDFRMGNDIYTGPVHQFAEGIPKKGREEEFERQTHEYKARRKHL